MSKSPHHKANVHSYARGLNQAAAMQVGVPALPTGPEIAAHAHEALTAAIMAAEKPALHRAAFDDTEVFVLRLTDQSHRVHDNGWEGLQGVRIAYVATTRTAAESLCCHYNRDGELLALHSEIAVTTLGQVRDDLGYDGVLVVTDAGEWARPLLFGQEEGWDMSKVAYERDAPPPAGESDPPYSLWSLAGAEEAEADRMTLRERYLTLAVAVAAGIGLLFMIAAVIAARYFGH